MEITGDLFRFPLDDPAWKRKALTAALLGIPALLIFPIYFLYYGYGLRVMRQAVRGEPLTLPAWDDWGGMLADGLRYLAVTVVYLLPAVAILVMAAGLFMLAGMGLPLLVVAAGDSSAAAAGSAFGLLGAMAIFFLGFGIMFLLALPLQFLSLVALTRAVALDRLSAAFDLREVWALARAGLGNYLVAYLVWMGVLIGLSFAVQLLMVTVILMCALPLIAGLLGAYSSLLMGALLGRAYHRTRAALAPAV